MPIRNLRILPPFAIARFGSSPIPLEAFDLEVSKDAPLDFQHIVPQETLEVDPVSGAVVGKHTPKPGHLRFRDELGIRPVCPFLEVYAETAERTWEPLTLDVLNAAGLGPEAVRWTVEVGNLKVFRQTGDEHDKVLASVEGFNDHDIHELRGGSENFLKAKAIPFGSVRYIKPTKEFQEIRFRFTPATGKVYGASRYLNQMDPVTKKPIPDPVFADDPEGKRIVYDDTRGKWRGFFADQSSPLITNPSDIYEGFNQQFCRGYLDDVCDGPVSVELTLGSDSVLRSHAWISAAAELWRRYA